MTDERARDFTQHAKSVESEILMIGRDARKALVILALALLLAACQTASPPPADTAPPADTTPEPTTLTASVRNYYATDGTRTLVLEDIIASRAVTLAVVAECFLHSPPSISAARYAGTISVGTLGSNRSLPMSGTAASPGASSISCSITGETGDGTAVNITVR